MHKNNKTYCYILSFCLLGSLVAGCRTIEKPKNTHMLWSSPEWIEKKEIKDPTWPELRKYSIEKKTPLGLFDLADIALLNNPSTRQAWEQTKVNFAQLKQQESLLYPSLAFKEEFKNTKTVANDKTDNVNQALHYNGLTLEMLVFDFGGRAAKINGAEYDLISSNFKFNQALQDVMLDVGTSYFTFYSSQENIVAKTADVKNAATTLFDAKKRFAAGLVSKLDVLQAEANYYDEVFALESAKGEEKTAWANLTKSLGLYSDCSFEIVKPKRHIPRDISKKTIHELIDFAMLARQDVKAQKAMVWSKQEAVRGANSDMFPYVNFAAAYNDSRYAYYNNPPKHWGDSYTYNAFDIIVKWDVFDGFKKYNIKMAAAHQLEIEKEKLKKTELDVSRDVWTKYYNYKTAIKKYKAAKAFYRSSKGSYDLALKGYNSGVKSMLDVTQAQSDLSDSHSKLITAEKDYFISVLNLIYSLGAMYPGMQDLRNVVI